MITVCIYVKAFMLSSTLMHVLCSYEYSDLSGITQVPNSCPVENMVCKEIWLFKCIHSIQKIRKALPFIPFLDLSPTIHSSIPISSISLSFSLATAITRGEDLITLCLVVIEIRTELTLREEDLIITQNNGKGWS